MSVQRVQIKFGKEDLILETGKMAKQANGAVVVQYGGTVILVSACASKEPREGIDFFPLTVEYQEKTYAAGKIPGGFFKREGRPSEGEILAARLIDRPIRPLFPKSFINEVQVMAIVLSSDGINDPDILAVIGASAALSISDIPFSGPIGACRVGMVDGEFILNPTYEDIQKGSLDIVVVGKKEGILMLESKASQVPEATFLEGINFGYKNLQEVIRLQEELQKKSAKEKMQIQEKNIDENLLKEVKSLSEDALNKVCQLTQKEEREDAVDQLQKKLIEALVPQGYEEADVKKALLDVEQAKVRGHILKEGKRMDGRQIDEIRPITCETGVLPRTHGSGLFTRGSTQSLAVTTLGTSADEQMIEALEGEKFKSFMLHYSFPPFSVGETGPVRGPGRREIGHGALAERALTAVMPSKTEFPYTVRVVSEILESNGSSSMATVCAATLSLMDAGVPIKEPVAGAAMGLIKEGNKSIILTDISGLEDHFGDMDFKVAGTKNGITAMQLDLKVPGISFELLKDAVSKAEKARAIILQKIIQVIEKPKAELSQYAPRITILKINQDRIGELIGPGGKTIKKIINATGVTIDIEDDGSVMVASTNPEASEKALKIIKGLTSEVEVGTIYTGRITKIMNFGAFCEIFPGKEGLIHVSELAKQFVKNVEDVVKVGDEVTVKVIGVDELGRINLSKKQVES